MSLEAAGNGSEGAGKDRRYNVGTRRNIEGCYTVVTLLRYRELGVDGGDAQYPGGRGDLVD